MNVSRSWRPSMLPGDARNGVRERWIAPSRGAFYSQFRRRYPDSRVRISRLQTQAWISLQTGKPWQTLTRSSVQARPLSA